MPRKSSGTQPDQSLSSTGRPCVYCGRNDSPKSAEDVIPAWINALFPDVPWDLQRITFDDTTQAKQGRATERFKAMGRSPGLITTRVCRRCNNQWMSTLEQMTRPILTPLIEDQPSMLTLDQQRVISAWALKTTMPFECLRGKKSGESFYKQSEREGLMATLDIPPYVNIYLARYFGYRGIFIRETVAPTRIIAHADIDDSCIPQFDGHAITFLIKHLALQVVGIHKIAGTGSEDHPPLMLHMPSFWRELQVQIWPPNRDVNRYWPPATDLDDEGLDVFIGRWGKLIMN